MPSGDQVPGSSKEASPSKSGKGQVKALSCAECRRLKLRCDRAIPCSNCVKRHCAELCPHEIKTTRRAGGLTAQGAEDLQRRLSMMEDLLQANGIDYDGPDPKRRASDQSPQVSKRQRSDSEDIRHVHQQQPQPYSSTPLPPQYDYSLSGQYGSQAPDRRISIGVGAHGANEISGGPPRSPIEHSHGTLVLSQSGSSRYLGPTAGTEWLKNQEMADLDSVPPSPTQPPLVPQTENMSDFPFPKSKDRSTQQLIDSLPQMQDALVLIDSYYRYFTWNHDVAPRRSIQPLLDRAFKNAASIHMQQLALVYMILAIGSLYNLELPQHDPQAEEFCNLSKACLTKGDFLNHNTIAGVQTILMMGHYHLETEKGRNGNQAWPLWGLAMRIVVAMGLHRDGGRWNLPFEVVDERRQVFWEAHTIEVFQANCFSRPSCLVPRYIDTAFPAPYPAPDDTFPKAYKTLKFEICQMSARILDMGMGVDPAPYSDVHDMYMRLCTFERRIPFNFRCRSALCALPSVYSDPAIAVLESPEPNRRQLTQTLQQFTLALNVSENILYLQRPYFVMAMHDQPLDPTRSIYGHSYLAVVERCNVIIQVVNGLYDLLPTISVRHWFFWYHLFTAAVCVGTLILRHPQSVLAPFALSQIDQAIGLFTAVLKHNPSPSMVKNHEWLVQLRSRAVDKMNQDSKTVTTNASPSGEGEDELLGWRTRLIEQAGAGIHKARNITPRHVVQAPSTTASSPMPPALAEVLQQHLDYSLDSTPLTSGQGDISTDLMLHQYWDPMIFSDSRTDQGPLPSTNWWSWENMGLDGNKQQE